MRVKIKALLLTCASVALLSACSTTEQLASPPVASLYTNAAPLDLRLTNWPYPYPVREFKTTLQGQPASMMYMDVPA